MDDVISRQVAIDAIRAMQTYNLFAGDDRRLKRVVNQAEAMTKLKELPSVQPEPLTCHGCKHRNEWYEGCKTCIRLLSYKTDNYEEEHT